MRRRDFELLVEQAFESLPDQFKRLLDNVVVLIEDWPDDATLAGVGLDPEVDTLFGLFEGEPRTAYGRDYGMAEPERITIFQGPLEEACESLDELVDEIRKTVLHEVGHYFGLNEEQVEHL